MKTGFSELLWCEPWRWATRLSPSGTSYSWPQLNLSSLWFATESCWYHELTTFPVIGHWESITEALPQSFWFWCMVSAGIPHGPFISFYTFFLDFCLEFFLVFLFFNFSKKNICLITSLLQFLLFPLPSSFPDNFPSLSGPPLSSGSPQKRAPKDIQTLHNKLALAQAHSITLSLDKATQ